MALNIVMQGPPIYLSIDRYMIAIARGNERGESTVSNRGTSREIIGNNWLKFKTHDNYQSF